MALPSSTPIDFIKLMAQAIVDLLLLGAGLASGASIVPMDFSNENDLICNIPYWWDGEQHPVRMVCIQLAAGLVFSLSLAILLKTKKQSLLRDTLPQAEAVDGKFETLR